MATYLDLYGLLYDQTLLKRMAAACLVHAEAIRANGSATAAQKAWALRVYVDPLREAPVALNAALAANAGLTVAQIQAATDAALLGAVANAMAVLAAT